VATAAAAGQPKVSIYFVQGEQLAPITRWQPDALRHIR
jgi:hypothetical protein